MSLTYLNLKTWPALEEIARSVQSGEQKAVDLVQESLNCIQEHQEFQSVIATTEHRAIERAQEIDSLVASGKSAGRLAGVPFIAKDNFLTFGSETTAASNILKGFKAPYQATAIERLEAEGAICVAKANLDAFAHGASTENSDYFTTKNPHDVERVPGGSSGGSGAAVALRLAPFALGTDTGGSIRLPASFCGVVGYKPSYGLVSRSGVVAMASSTDVVGPITQTVEDTRLVLDILAGQDPLDSTTIQRQQSYIQSARSTRKITIGVVKEYMTDGVDESVKKLISKSIQSVESTDIEVVELSVPSLPLALAAYYIVVPAEVSSNLGRYDGQRFGHSVMQTASNLDDSYELTRQQGFGSEAKRRIMTGTYVLSSGYYDAYYKKAQTVRTKIINDFARAFEQVDFLAGPVSPSTAFKIGEIADPLSLYLLDIMTVAASMAGLPAISVPVGEVDGLPVGLQLIGPYKKDSELLDVAQIFEENHNG